MNNQHMHAVNSTAIMMVYIFNAPYRQYVHVNVNELQFASGIQTLRYSAVELFVYVEDEQINVHFGSPKHRHGCQALACTAAEGSPVWGEERAVKHFNWYNACIFKIR